MNALPSIERSPFNLATSLTTGTLGLITDLSMASGGGGDAIGTAPSEIVIDIHNYYRGFNQLIRRTCPYGAIVALIDYKEVRYIFIVVEGMTIARGKVIRSGAERK